MTIDLPASRQFAAWLSAFNSGSQAEMLAYHEAHFPYDSASEDLAGIHRELQLSHYTGGFELTRGEESTPTRFVAILKERDSDQFAHAAMDVHTAAPHPVVKFEIHPIDTPEDLYPARLREREALGALRVEIETAVQRDRFSGAVLIAKHGTPIFAEAFGLADRAAQVCNTLHARFRIGSLNKMFTAVAVLRLMQNGRLAVTDPLGHFLTDYPNREIASKATIHHLLTHTGGTGDIFTPERAAHRLELRTHTDYLKLFSARDLLFEPGARYEYSNYGFILLGAVIEAVTATSYYDAVDALVYEPAGMTATGVAPRRGECPRSVDRLHTLRAEGAVDTEYGRLVISRHGGGTRLLDGHRFIEVCGGSDELSATRRRTHPVAHDRHGANGTREVWIRVR
jgi:D-alanyl-D-alanine carboxypeptidase